MTNAFTMVFRPEDLKRLLDQNPDQIVITCGLTSKTTVTGEKVGAFTVRAQSAFKQERHDVVNFFIPGCPIPPCPEIGLKNKAESIALETLEN